MLHIDSKPTICFVALTAYPLLSGKKTGHVIGPDVQHFLIANHLQSFFKTSFITYGEGNPSDECIKGISIIKIYDREKRPNLFIKTILLWKALRKANANLYFQQGGGGALVPLLCKLLKRPCVVAIGSDAYVCKQITDWGFFFGFLSRLEITLADAIIVQSFFQKNMLANNFKKNGIIIKTLFPITYKETPVKSNPPTVLWVGSIASVKQPELFIILAKSIKNVKFQMIAAKGDNKIYYERIMRMTAGLANFDFKGFVPFDEIDMYYEKASILVNTSKFEGFPNAFIQAWANYTPVISLNSDPDEVICKYDLGYHSKTFTQLIKDVVCLINDESSRHKKGNNGRLYVEKEHNLSKSIRLYHKLFDRFISPNQ